jgi:hypothetical protein
MVKPSQTANPRRKVVPGVVAAIIAFAFVRIVYFPAQLAHSPYRDATVGPDLIRQFFFEIPRSAWFVGGIFAAVVFFVVTRWRSRKKPI